MPGLVPAAGRPCRGAVREKGTAGAEQALAGIGSRFPGAFPRSVPVAHPVGCPCAGGFGDGGSGELGGAAGLGSKPTVSVRGARQGPPAHEGRALGAASRARCLPGRASPPRVQCRCWEESPRPSDSAQHAESSAGGMLCLPAIASAHAHAPGREDAPAVKFGPRDLWAAKSAGSCSETVGKLWDVPGAPGHGPHSVCLSSLFPSTDSLGLSPARSPAPGDWRGSGAGGVRAAPHRDGGNQTASASPAWLGLGADKSELQLLQAAGGTAACPAPAASGLGSTQDSELHAPTVASLAGFLSG